MMTDSYFGSFNGLIRKSIMLRMLSPLGILLFLLVSSKLVVVSNPAQHHFDEFGIIMLRGSKNNNSIGKLIREKQKVITSSAATRRLQQGNGSSEMGNNNNNKPNNTNKNSTEADGNFLDTVSEEVNDVFTSKPTSWSTAQKVGVAAGSVVAVFLLALIYWCGRRFCCKGNKKKTKEQNSTMETSGSGPIPNSQNVNVEYSMKRPYVKRSSSYSITPVDATDPSTLPFSVILHGALKLRDANLLGQSIRVAVIDSGLDKDHPGFNNKVKRQVWYRKGTPLSQDDHGTHVAGTIHLLAPEADLYDYRVFGGQGTLDGDHAIAAAIREAVDVDRCHVINMSLRVSYPIVPAVQQAVEYAYAKGVHMVCAAGNSGDGDPTTNELFAFPARWEETLSIAAVKVEGDLPVAEFSESNPQVDFAAIGVDVISFKPGGGYQAMQGTSMAAPHVTGLIAALMSYDGRQYKPRALKKMITSKYAIDIATRGPDTSSGVGFVTYLNKKELEQLLSSVKRTSNGMRAQAY
jgi:subtilisin family serine protease